MTTASSSHLVPEPIPSATAEAVVAVDSHAHVFVRDLPLASQRRHAPVLDAPPEAYLAHLDRHGLTHGVLVQPSFLGTDNAYLLAALSRFPARLRGVVVVDPAVDEATLSAWDRQGVVGVRLNLVGLPLPDLRAPAWQTLFARLRTLDWHLELHRSAADLPELLAAVAPAGCRIVVDHFGRPDPQLGPQDPGFRALLRSADGGRLWVKLSAAYRNAQGDPARDDDAACSAAADLLRAFGPERLVWGSDWPHTQHEDRIDYPASRAALDRWVPDAAQRRRILAATPAELFRFR